MALRKKMLIVVGVTAIGMILILYAASRSIVLGGFVEMEEQHARQNTERALSALSDDLAALDTMVFDWAAWDDTCVFIEDANEGYIQSNLVDETFTSPRLNLVLFVNPSGEVVFDKGFDLDSGEETPVPESLAEHLANNALLLRHPDTESSVTGIVSLPKGPMLIASRPILTSEEKGPIRGTLIMGRYLNSAQVERLAEITHLSLTARQFDDSQMPSDFLVARSSLSGEAPIIVRPLGAKSIAGYALVEDIYGEPGLILKVDMPREIHAQGQAIMLYLVLSLLVVGLIFSGVALLLVDRMVLSRLTRLNDDVSSIGASGDLSTRVLTSGEDELSSLAGAINEMLEALEQSQGELQEGEERYRLLFNSGDDIVLVSVMTDEGMPDQLIEVNDVACRKLGYTRDELLQRSLLSVAVPRSGINLSGLEKGILTGKRMTFEAAAMTKDGARIPVEVNAHAFNFDGQPAVLSIARDITRRKQTEKALQASEQRLRDVARTTGDWIWEVDAEGRYTYVNSVVKQILGYTPEEVLGGRYEDFFHPGDRETLKALIRQVSSRKEPFAKLAYQGVHKDGHMVVLESIGLPLIGAEGDLLGYRGAHRDVTAERQLEERLAAVYVLGRELVLSRDVQQIAQATVDASRLLFRCQLCGLWLIDEEERVLVRQANRAAEPVASIPKLPLNKKGVMAAVAQSGEPLYVPDVREEPRYIDAGIGTRSELCVSLKVGERVIGVLNIESEELDAFTEDDRQLFFTLADRAALALENARLYGAVTQQREQLRALAMRLAEAEESERQRLARELHDQVGQNLTALGINLNILRAQMSEEAMSLLHPRLDDSLGLVEQTTERIRSVMADLRPPVLDDYGLVAALRWYGAQFASRVSVTVTVQGDELVPRLAAPVENALFRIAQEALTNVAKHAQATQTTVSVEVENETVRLIISDDGIGFDPVRVTGPDRQRGWGMLTMAERAEAVGSRFRVGSHPSQGTQVIVEVER